MQTMTGFPKTKFQYWLARHDACSGGRKWVSNRTPQQTWDDFENLGWMFWLIRKMRHENPDVFNARSMAVLEHCAYRIAQECDDDKNKAACDFVRAMIPRLPTWSHGRFQPWTNKQTQILHPLVMSEPES